MAIFTTMKHTISFCWILLSCYFLLGVAHGFDEHESGPAAEFYVYDHYSLPCILIKINATIFIEHNFNKKYHVDVPKNANVRGNCGYGSDSQLLLTWNNSFKMNLQFQKSNVTDAWYVDRIIFSYSTAEKIFNEPDGVDDIKEIRSPESFTQWLTPIGQAYNCNITQEIRLVDLKTNVRVTITFKQIKIQPFAIMTQRQYGDCKGSYTI